MSHKWHLITQGERPGELILARLTPGKLIKQVASAFPYRKGYIYKLYPTYYKGFDSINQPITVSIHEINFKGKNYA